MIPDLASEHLILLVAAVIIVNRGFDSTGLKLNRAAYVVVQAFDFMVEERIRRGELVEVLRHQSAPGPPVHALTLPRRNRVPKVRALLDFFSEVFGTAATA